MKTTAKPARLYVSTVFLDRAARLNKNLKSSAYSLTLGVRVPDYEVERKLWLDQHFEGGYLFHDQLKVEIFDEPNSAIRYDWQSRQTGALTTTATPTRIADGKLEVSVLSTRSSDPASAERYASSRRPGTLDGIAQGGVPAMILNEIQAARPGSAESVEPVQKKNGGGAR